MPRIDEAKNQWIVRVLGIDPGGAGGGDFPARWQAARDRWQAASAAVDAQIAALQRVLLATDDPELHQIAEVGLNAITANHKVRLLAALAEIGDGTAPAALARAGKKALALARGFAAHLEGDARVAACDDNPYGARVAIRATLVPALREMAEVLGAAPARG